MAVEMWITLGILATAIVLFVTEWLRVDVVAFGVVVTLMLTGILTVEDALAGFSNSAVLSIAALFVVGGATMQTGLAASIGRRILRIGGTNPIRLTFVLMGAVALLSGFLSDTGTVALLLPAAIALANDAKLPPSKLLIPLSYGALLGGALTLIGTTPNLIVAEMLEDNGLTSFGFFSFTPLGLALLTAGIGFMLLVGRKLLPARISAIEGQPVENPEELIDHYRLPGNLYHLRIRRTSELIGRTLSECSLRERFRINVIDIQRRREPRLTQVLGGSGQELIPMPIERFSIQPEKDIVLMLDDILVVQGEMGKITRASNQWNLGVQPINKDEGEMLVTEEIGIAEVLLPPRSRLAGRTVVDIRFGSQYRLNVLGLSRPGINSQPDLKSTPLRFGDILLVQGPWKNILALRRQSRDFVVLGQPEASMGAQRSEKAIFALAILAVMLVLMISNLVSVAAASMLAALLMVLTGCLNMDEAYQSIDWKSVILIAGMLPMSTALTQTGAIEAAADGFTAALGEQGPLAVMAALFLVTSAFTQVLSNTATTVLIAPIGLAAAQTLGIAPQSFLMVVAIAASMAFGSPVASPANTLVMGAGGYTFRDYLKVGLPLILLMMVISLLVLPLLFPY